MKRNKLLLAAAIIGTVYFYLIFYLIYHFTGSMSVFTGSMSVTDSAGTLAGIVTELTQMHMFYVGLAALFNWIGWALRARWAALVAGILYAVSIVCMFLYAVFVLLEMIFCFVAFANMQRADGKKQE